jgi:exopolysaccharide biosynthesis WecB/TagA/CpsF family protein
VAIGVGGTFAFLAGVKRRAPRFVRAAGLEWLHRLAQEPLRLGGRYARDLRYLVARFLPAVMAQRRAGR